MEIKAGGKLYELPDEIFKNEEEMRIAATVCDWSASNLSIAAEILTKLGIELTHRNVIGLRTRMRRILGKDVIPFETRANTKFHKFTEDELLAIEASKKKTEESRAKKALASAHKPLPYKKTVFREAKSPAERRYMFEYQIVRKMYRDYLEKKINFGTYNDARKWFYEKYRE